MTLISEEDKSVLKVVPLGMQNSALVLKDEDGNNVLTEFDEFSSVSEQSITPAAINIENSSDVIIGPVTQFNGPVTIYQNVTGSPNSIQNGSANSYQNGKLVKTDSTSSDSPHAAEKPNKHLLYSKHLKYIAICVAFLVIVLTITAVAILTYKSDPADQKGHNETIPDNDVLKPAGPGAIIEKKVWGGIPATNKVALPHPTHLVIISHTVTPFCKDFAHCSARMKSMQAYHIANNKSPDIGYNFVVGGDGNVYVGRGWDTRNFHAADSIGISFIGNYITDNLTPDMINVTKKLLEDGLKEGKLAADYKLIAHNQTFATESPGPNVYKVIKTWPHFDPTYYMSS